VSTDSRSTHTTTDTYEAAALTLPDLKPNTSCHYNAVLELHDGDSGWTTQIGKEASLDCTALLKAAGVSSVSDLPGYDRIPDGIAKLAGPNCEIRDLSSDKKRALFECRTGHSHMDGEIYITTSRTSTVLSTPEGKPVFSLSLPHNSHPIPGILTTNNGDEYLLLLRDGIKLVWCI